jgi:cold-inducible RNA-binding protein
MTRKLFVGGLSWSTNDDGLRQAFERFGQIDEAKVILDRETGRSRGFGFVTFIEAASARNAMSEMNGTNLDGRSIKVNEAEERPRQHGGGGGGGRHNRSGYSDGNRW